jgi:hypothetical protein
MFRAISGREKKIPGQHASPLDPLSPEHYEDKNIPTTMQKDKNPK